MTEIRFVALPTETVAHYRAGGADANGQVPERHIASGGGNPCRHCMDMIADGDEMLILAHRPFPEAQPYAEIGPILLHADACERWEKDSAEIPPFLESPGYIVRGYSADNRIVYGTGRVIATPDIPERADTILDRDDIAFVHVRSAANNCFHCRIESA